MFQPADTVSVAIFVAVVAWVLGSAAFGMLKAGLSTKAVIVAMLLIFAWLGVLGFLVGSSTIEAQPMPRAAIFLAASLLGGIVLGFSPVGKRLATLPLWYLVAFQAFRLPLELVLHAWAEQSVIPTTMTWTGRNFDIVTGILALVLLPWAERYLVARIFNIIGLALLVNVMFVALLSSPLPFAWPVTPTLQLAFHIPYYLIVPVCVAGALAGHIILTRKLLKWRSPPLD